MTPQEAYKLPLDKLLHMCAEKKTYRSLFIVFTASNVMGLDFYQCPLCEFWHLTSKKKFKEVA